MPTYVKNLLRLLGSTDRDITIALVNYIEQYVIPKSVKLIFYFNLFALSWKENGKKNEAVKMKNKLNWLCEIEMIIFFILLWVFSIILFFIFKKEVVVHCFFCEFKMVLYQYISSFPISYDGSTNIQCIKLISFIGEGLKVKQLQLKQFQSQKS